MVFASTPLSPAPLPPAAVLTCTFEYSWVKFVAQSWNSGKSSDEPASEIGLDVAVRVPGRMGCAMVVWSAVEVETEVDVDVAVVVEVATDVDTEVDTEVAVDTDVAVDVSVIVVAVPDIVVTVTVAGLLAVETAVLVTVTVDFEPEVAA
jgi:hypothetical protein